MGNKGAKPKLDKKLKLTSKDIKFLVKQTGKTSDEIKEVKLNHLFVVPILLFKHIKTYKRLTLNLWLIILMVN
jgi:glucan phosphorylase